MKHNYIIPQLSLGGTSCKYCLSYLLVLLILDFSTTGTLHTIYLNPHPPKKPAKNNEKKNKMRKKLKISFIIHPADERRIKTMNNNNRRTKRKGKTGKKTTTTLFYNIP